MNIPDELIPALKDMLEQLKWERLVVVKAPPLEYYHLNHRRAVESRNPEWYSALCSAFPRKGRLRKNPRTNIRRGEIMKRLTRMINEKTSESKYAPYLIEVAKEKSSLLL